jgi:hypothetical protein
MRKQLHAKFSLLYLFEITHYRCGFIAPLSGAEPAKEFQSETDEAHFGD